MKFTTRDLFLVTMIVALAVGWWVDRGRLAKMHDSERSLRLESDAEVKREKAKREMMEEAMKLDGWQFGPPIPLGPAQKKSKKSTPAPNQPKP